MKETLFWILYIGTLLMVAYKISKALSYYHADYKKKDTKKLYKELSVIQIIEDYNHEIQEKNRNTLKGVQYIYVVDKSNKGIIEEIQEKNYEDYILIEVDEGLSALGKIQKGIESARDYFIVLDEYVEFLDKPDEILQEIESGDFVANGLLYEKEKSSFYGQIKNSYSNWHSLFAYLALGEIGLGESINFAYFAGKKKEFLENNLLNSLEVEDEHSLTNRLILYGYSIFQSRAKAINRRVIGDRIEFMDRFGFEIERLLLLSREATSMRVYYVTLFLMVLPSILLLYSTFVGFNYFILVLVSLLVKATDNFLIRKMSFGEKNFISNVVGEMFNDIFGILLILYRKSR